MSEAAHPVSNRPVPDSSPVQDSSPVPDSSPAASALQAVQEALDLRDNGGAASSQASAVISRPPAGQPPAGRA